MGQPEQKRARADKGEEIPGHAKHRLSSTGTDTTQHIAETRCLLDVCETGEQVSLQFLWPWPEHRPPQ